MTDTDTATTVRVERTGNVFHYVVDLTDEEARAVDWIGARYGSAEILSAAMSPADHHGRFPARVILTEAEAWDYRDALADENGNPDQIIPPCAGGTLADKLLALWEAIV